MTNIISDGIVTSAVQVPSVYLSYYGVNASTPKHVRIIKVTCSYDQNNYTR